jgi:hypothetical protein
MNDRIQALFEARASSDKDAAKQATAELMALAEKPVDWSYEVWEQTVGDLSHKKGSERAFAAQLLSRLAMSDPEKRILKDFDKLAVVLFDEKPTAARQAVQSLWRVGLAGQQQRDCVLDALTKRYEISGPDKHGAIARTDTIAALANLARETGDTAVVEKALDLIASEPVVKAQRRQRSAWNKVIGV